MRGKDKSSRVVPPSTVLPHVRSDWASQEGSLEEEKMRETWNFKERQKEEDIARQKTVNGTLGNGHSLTPSADLPLRESRQRWDQIVNDKAGGLEMENILIRLIFLTVIFTPKYGATQKPR